METRIQGFKMGSVLDAVNTIKILTERNDSEPSFNLIVLVRLYGISSWLDKLSWVKEPERNYLMLTWPIWRVWE